MVTRSSSSGWLRKRPLNHQSSGSFHNLQQDHRYQSTEEQHPPTSPSKRVDEGEHSSKPLRQVPLHALMPSLSLPMRSQSSDALMFDGDDSNSHHHPSGQRSHSTNARSSSLPITMPPSSVHKDRAMRNFAFHLHFEVAVAKLKEWNDSAMKNSARYEYLVLKAKPYIRRCFALLREIFLELISIKCTCKQKLLCIFIITITSSNYVYFVKMPIWSYEEEWVRWEEGMQRSVAALIPPLPSDDDISMNNYWRSNSKQLEQFPYLKQKKASKYAVPIPDYEVMGRTRGELAQKLRGHATQSCRSYTQNQDNPDGGYALPVLGITVATDTPGNRYLRRLLHTIDLTTVGSIVITWYDEQTEAQLVGEEDVGLSHKVIVQALSEFISHKGFSKIPWEKDFNDNVANPGTSADLGESSDDGASGNEQPLTTRLGDTASLKLLSETATSIDQFCIFDNNQSRRTCRNELLILHFPTNLGCSSGVNNALFTHPTAPHWLIVNYDIAYPPGVLNATGRELRENRRQNPDLAVHTFGYIYGRGKLENPWSNFIMTSCAVAKVGIWDEDIFPAYYEDDDFRDRIRYLLGKWTDVIGDPDILGDAPQYLMNDRHLIRYQTDRHVSVAHGPLAASTYLSGTHETMQTVKDEEAEAEKVGFFESLWLRLFVPETPPNPFQYESHRWNLVKEVSDAEGYFRCKHGALPDAGEHGDDAVRYFGWNERFLQPFVNRTRVTRMNESMPHLEQNSGKANGGGQDASPWSLWTFNATRRKCVHEAANLILQLPPSANRTNATLRYKALCSVC